MASALEENIMGVGNLLATTSMMKQWVPGLHANLESMQAKRVSRRELAAAQEAVRKIEDGLQTIDQIAERWAKADLKH